MLERYGLKITRRPGLDSTNDAGGVRPPLSVDAGGALWPGDARLESVVRAGGIQDPAAGSLSGGGQRSSWTRSADGGAVGPAGGDAGDAGPCFDQEVVPGGYAWWYLDAISDDGQHGLTVIAFVGSVFSPYYAWAGRRDPLDHCAFNVALYGPRASRWAMTERRRSAVTRSRDTLAIGRSSASWDARRARARHPRARRADPPSHSRADYGSPRGDQSPPLRSGRTGPALVEASRAARARHGRNGRASASVARVRLSSTRTPGLSQSSRRFPNGPGHALRPATGRRSSMTPSDGENRRLSLALAFDRNAHFDERPSPPSARLPRTRWGLARTTRADEGQASAVRSFEDTPFYSRGLVAHTLVRRARRVRCMKASRSIASPTLSSASCFRSECRGCSDEPCCIWVASSLRGA